MSVPPAIPSSLAAPGFLAASVLVAGGGAVGAWARFATGRVWIMAIGPIAASAFPWGTLTVNVLGSLAMGLLAGWLARHGGDGWFGGRFGQSESWRLLLGVGVLGGYTTFSAFALEFVSFVQRGALGLAALYTGLSLMAGFAALFAGLFLMRAVS